MAARGGAWWARNRLWVLLLVPLLLLAAAATSFRVQRIWLPHDWTRAHAPNASTMLFEQDFYVSNGVTLHRAVQITVTGVVPVRSFQGALAEPGATLYAVQVELAAAPDVVLEGCEVLLLGPDGTQYGTVAGTVDDPGTRGYPSHTVACVPAGAPGPSIGFDARVTPSEVPRPPSWLVAAAIAVPDGVRPDRVVLRWKPPDYAVLQVPR